MGPRTTPCRSNGRHNVAVDSGTAAPASLPNTPHHPRPGAALNDLIHTLEAQWQLGLKIREPTWSPVKGRKDIADKVYGQIQHLFYSAKPALNSVLQNFHVAPGLAHDSRLQLLHGLLKAKAPSPSSSAATPLNEAPKSSKQWQSCKYTYKATTLGKRSSNDGESLARCQKLSLISWELMSYHSHPSLSIRTVV